ncbi:hypothetical protein BC826DRAFT_1100757 [Russula brevipes]|nr:hypothetical protein BC826DRAFT_1100757 [Russula brevipes]
MRNVPAVSASEAVQCIASFLSLGHATVLTGAGVSIGSGVKVYRGKDRSWFDVLGQILWAVIICSASPNTLLTIHVSSTSSSSKIALEDTHFGNNTGSGFLPVRRTIPNPMHYALATLQHAGAVSPLITQNVDGLHHAVLRRVLPEPEKVHGQHGHYPRVTFQEWLGQANSCWCVFLAELERMGAQPKTNPDGDDL